MSRLVGASDDDDPTRSVGFGGGGDGHGLTGAALKSKRVYPETGPLMMSWHLAAREATAARRSRAEICRP